MRDKLIHAYFGINRAIIWRTIRDDVPPLKPAMRSLLNDLAAEEGPKEPASGQRDR